jgi:hypothetical protein
MSQAKFFRHSRTNLRKRQNKNQKHEWISNGSLLFSMRERKIFEQPPGGQLSPAQLGSVKKSLEGAVNPAHAL